MAVFVAIYECDDSDVQTRVRLGGLFRDARAGASAKFEPTESVEETFSLLSSSLHSAFIRFIEDRNRNRPKTLPPDTWRDWSYEKRLGDFRRAVVDPLKSTFNPFWEQQGRST